MKDIIKNWKGIALCFLLAVPAWLLGKQFEIIGGAVIAILLGMVITLFWKEKGVFEGGIKFTSKKILQWAVILLGFGLNLGVVYQTGMQSLPIIICTIATSLIIAFVLLLRYLVKYQLSQFQLVLIIMRLPIKFLGTVSNIRLQSIQPILVNLMLKHNRQFIDFIFIE